VLNHPQTPRSVVEFILCHEMLHLVLPPRDVSGHLKTHPPEFWEAENRVEADGRGISVVLDASEGGLRLQPDSSRFGLERWKPCLDVRV
jgi:hypothetical protein